MKVKILSFGKEGKLSPRFFCPYEIIKRSSPIAYRPVLSLELARVYNIFYISMLRRYRSDPSYIIIAECIDIQLDLTYEEEPIKILARETGAKK